jgi:chitin synthase
VHDVPVPSKLLDMCALRTDREFTHLRYSAATCDPNDFKSEGFTLRQVGYDPPRRTELFIVMTMYDEDEELFCRTMPGVMKNTAHLCKRERSKTWGKEGWKKVVVCIVSDGRLKMSARTLSVLAVMGVYQEDVAKVVEFGFVCLIEINYYLLLDSSRRDERHRAYIRIYSAKYVSSQLILIIYPTN